MSSLDGLIWSRCSIALTIPPGHIGAHIEQGKTEKKDEETKTG